MAQDTMTTELTQLIHDLTGSVVRVERNPELGLYGVALDDEPDIIGSGETESEALEDALATVRGWEE